MDIILLNGPPRCGKDTIANYIVQQYDYVHLTFKGELLNHTIDYFGIDKKVFHDLYENNKDTPIKIHKPCGNSVDMSARDMLIFVAETVYKQKYGKDYFVQLVINEIDNNNYTNVVISDLGFDIELDKVLKSFNTSDIRVVKVHRDNTSFKSDSRKYLNIPDEVQLYNVNNSTLDNLKKIIDDIM